MIAGYSIYSYNDLSPKKYITKVLHKKPQALGQK